MPAPSASVIRGNIINEIDTGAFPAISDSGSDLYKSIDDLSTAMATAWTTWQATMLFGGVTVTGSGIVPWVSTACSGGVLVAGPFTVTVVAGLTAPGAEYTTALQSGLIQVFSAYATGLSFNTSAMSYTGASTSTPTSPGTFTAASALVMLSDILVQTGSISGLANAVTGALSPSSFDLSNSKVPDLMTAIEAGLQKTITDWEGTAAISGNTVTGVSAPVSGSGVGLSATDAPVT